MKKRVFFILIAAVFLAPWPVAYAFESVNGANSGLNITPADTANAPRINGAGVGIGSVTAGDLFQVDMTGVTGDKAYRLMITNSNELAKNYRFMNFEIGIYVRAAGTGGWQKLTAADGGALTPVYISMHGGTADFTLPGGAIYKVMIVTGCFESYGTRDGTKPAIPRFYLAAE
jgi:hypothetical protein